MKRFVFWVALTTVICLGGVCWNIVYPNSIYRVNHPYTESIATGTPETEVIELLGQPYDCEKTSNGGKRLVYRTVVNWDKFTENRRLIISTDFGGRITNTKSIVDK